MSECPTRVRALRDEARDRAKAQACAKPSKWSHSYRVPSGSQIHGRVSHLPKSEGLATFAYSVEAVPSNYVREGTGEGQDAADTARCPVGEPRSANRASFLGVARPSAYTVQPSKPFPSKTGLSSGNLHDSVLPPGRTPKARDMSPIGDRKGTRLRRSESPFGGLPKRCRQRDVTRFPREPPLKAGNPRSPEGLT